MFLDETSAWIIDPIVVLPSSGESFLLQRLKKAVETFIDSFTNSQNTSVILSVYIQKSVFHESFYLFIFML